MEETKKEVKEKVTKVSYEDLNKVAGQLSQENMSLKQYNQQLIMQLKAVDNIFKRLDYLFKVLENGSKFNKSFLDNCIAEIEELLTVPDEDKEPEK